MSAILRHAVLAAVLPVLGGCAIYRPYMPVPQPSALSAESASAFAQAEVLADRAEDVAGLDAAIAGFEEVLRGAPGRPGALTAVSDLVTLRAAAFGGNRIEKGRSYRLAMRYAEQAMCAQPEFVSGLSTGQVPWEACASLTADDADAVLCWVRACLLLWGDAMTPAERICQRRLLTGAARFLDHAESIVPAWQECDVMVARGLLLLALPAGHGGDRLLARRTLDRAVDGHGDRLLARWARSKYFLRFGEPDYDRMHAELLWIVKQDLSRFTDPRPWRAFFQRDAVQLLDSHYGFF